MPSWPLGHNAADAQTVMSAWAEHGRSVMSPCHLVQGQLLSPNSGWACKILDHACVPCMKHSKVACRHAAAAPAPPPGRVGRPADEGGGGGCSIPVSAGAQAHCGGAGRALAVTVQVDFSLCLRVRALPWLAGAQT